MINLVFLLLSILIIHCGHPVEQSDTYDAVIYGSTPAGIIAGVNLAQKDKQVLIVSQSRHLGAAKFSGVFGFAELRIPAGSGTTRTKIH